MNPGLWKDQLNKCKELHLLVFDQRGRPSGENELKHVANEITYGKLPKCGFRIVDDSVDKFHCRMVVEGEDHRIVV